MLTCGIDVGEGHAYPALLDLEARRFLFPDKDAVGREAAARWALARRPAAIAIDSPPRPHATGALSDADYRRQHGIELRGGSEGPARRRVAPRDWRLLRHPR